MMEAVGLTKARKNRIKFFVIGFILSLTTASGVAKDWQSSLTSDVAHDCLGIRKVTQT
jgi:hypothetical protein